MLITVPITANSKVAITIDLSMNAILVKYGFYLAINSKFKIDFHRSSSPLFQLNF